MSNYVRNKIVRDKAILDEYFIDYDLIEEGKNVKLEGWRINMQDKEKRLRV